MENYIKFFCLAISLCSTALVSASPKIVDRVAAVVNNDVVLESSVNDMIKTVKSGNSAENLPDNATLRQQILDRLINDTLILQQANKAQVSITDSDVDNAINDIAKQNRISLQELKSHLARAGINFARYRNRIRSEMAIEDIRMNEVRRRIAISPSEVDALAKVIAEKPNENIDVNISHILISIPDSPTKQQLADAQNKANTVIQKLRAGESFSRLAATYSNDDQAFSGGSLGWKKINELPSLFEEPLIRAQKGDIVGPIRSGVGFHILKVNDTRAQVKKSLTVTEVNARHILLKTNLIFDDQQAQEKLNRIRDDILSNKTTFDAAAKAYSEDPGSKDKGGELGWSMPDRYDESFKRALLSLKKGEISVPIKSAFGWHIIQLLDTRQSDKTDLAQKDQAYRMIFNRKFGEEAQVWVQELRADAYINIIDDNK
ncbi:peptidylprolyl isomerase SurA [Utexia brackfieldae]|uniref:peptidylprolyl isomerase SurA n=1 Tax=Utexia brackfieldae TaxID=3074108 RepID=UPI00370D3027